jgi:DNA-directed RNA polymerase specialized sigma24 family protein
MSAAGFQMEKTRSGLSEAILSELASWPEIHRQVFVEAHYRGLSVEQVSHSLGMNAVEIRIILQQCERKLRQALRSFRDFVLEADIPAGLRPPMAARSGYLY